MKVFVKDIRLFFKQMLLVAYKDLKYLALSPLFFLFLGISFVFLSYNFPRELFRFAASYAMSGYGQGFNQQGGNIHFNVFVSHISYLNLILLFVVPTLAMKLLAEEKRNHTFDLLMTSPLSSLQMVLGKYFSLLTVLALFFAVFFVLSLIHCFFDRGPFWPSV